MNEDFAAGGVSDVAQAARSPSQGVAAGMVRAIVARRYFNAATLVALIATLVVLWTPPQIAPPRAQLVALGYGSLALSALLLRLARPGWLESALTLHALAATVVIGAAALLMEHGLGGPAIGFFGLFVGLVTAVFGVRRGAVVALFAVGVVVLLTCAHTTGWIAEPAPVDAVPLALHAALHLLIIGSSFGGGWVVSLILWRQVQAAQQGERRFRGLLHIAVDAYWELGPDHRLTALTRERGGGHVAGAVHVIGRRPWELPALHCEPAVLERLRADLDARQGFRDVPVAWADDGGGDANVRHFVISGEPRFDAEGRDAGYWGVARDVTDAHRARAELAATESRYQGLFAHLPTALLVDRAGRVFDANPAALRLFGYDDLHELIGTDTQQLCADAAERELLRRRRGELAAMTDGDALPVGEMRLKARDGRLLSTRASAVTIETAAGRAILAMFVDDTERKAAEEAVRRSEAMLSHLVASSPDLITLTDLDDDRLVMVNQTFERVMDYTAADVVGGHVPNLGIWADPAQRAAFVARVRDSGSARDVATHYRTRSGRLRPMLATGTCFVHDGREFLVINARDVTAVERSRLEREAILDNASIGIALTRHQVFQVVNKAFEEMLGWPSGALVGLSAAIIWPTENAFRELSARIGPLIERGEKVDVECALRHHDGSTLSCRLMARPVDPVRPVRAGTIWIVEDITERQRVGAALARALDEAQAANRAKSAFLANTSHELRTPLNGLLGMAQLARQPGLTTARRDQYLAQITDSAQALAHIVSDVLDLAKIEAGKLELEHAPFDLRAMLQTLRRGYATLASTQALTITVEIDAAIGEVLGDALRVRQILTNYLGNAVKFTPTGCVTVSARRLHGDLVRLQVTDTGPGIDADTQARLFRPFSQADDSITRRYGGSGLGLSICRELALLMGGTVGVISAPGEGSCFWAELPLPVRAAVLEPVRAEREGADDVVGARVLVVDDNEINVMVASAQLEQLGLRVGQAVDGQQAVDMVLDAAARGEAYDLVLMDLQMPIKSGHQVTRELRRRFSVSELPIVAYTAAALTTEREAALTAGMNDFLAKPTEPGQLRAMVARWVGGRRGAVTS